MIRLFNMQLKYLLLANTDKNVDKQKPSYLKDNINIKQIEKKITEGEKILNKKCKK